MYNLQATASLHLILRDTQARVLDFQAAVKRWAYSSESEIVLRSFERLLLSVILLFLTAVAVAQDAASANPFNSDSDVAVPVATGILGRKDATALTEVLEHLRVVGIDAWGGMQGTGKITFGPQDSPAYDATLSSLGDDRFRLDAQTKKGPVSVRIHRGLGKVQGPDGTLSRMPFDTALAGIFPFEILRVAHLAGPSTSLIDHGLAGVGGVTLHRITLEVGSMGRNPETKSRQTLAIDFYFDPASHLLVKSAASVLMEEGQRTKFLTVATYADYRKVGSALIPFRYTETINGEQSQSLQLSDVQLNPALDATYFAF